MRRHQHGRGPTGDGGPGALAVISPLLIGFVSLQALGGFLVGALVTGFLAIFMANAGGAWDNAKKFVEAGNVGGKGRGSPRHGRWRYGG